MNGLLQRIPDIRTLEQFASDFDAGSSGSSPIAALFTLVEIGQTLSRPLDLPTLVEVVQDLLEVLQKLRRQLNIDRNELNALAEPLTNLLQTLGEPLDIDVSGLTQRLPEILDSIQTALPDLLTLIESLGDSYNQIQDFLENSALAESGSFSQEAALTDIERAFNQFREPINEALNQLGNLLPTLPSSELINLNDLQQLRNILAIAEDFGTNLPTNTEEILPLISQNLLVVVSVEQLQELLLDFDNFLALPQSNLLNNPINFAREAIATSFVDLDSVTNTLKDAIANCDLANPEDYIEIENSLNAIETAISPAQFNSVLERINQLYSQIINLISSPDLEILASRLETIFTTYPERLLNLFPANTLSAFLNQVTDGINAVVDRLIVSVSNVFEGAEGLLAEVDRLTNTIISGLANSGIEQIYQTLLSLLTRLQQVSETIAFVNLPTKIEDLLNQLRTQLEVLGIGDIMATIERGFTNLENLLTTNITELSDTLIVNLRRLSAMVFEALQIVTQPINDVTANLTTAVEQLNQLFASITTEFQSAVDRFSQFAMGLENFSFEPPSSQAIAQIDELRTRLQAINPNSLTDPERLAIKAALAILENLDLETAVIDGLVTGFGEAQNQLRGLLNQLTNLLNRVRQQIQAFDPERLLMPVFEILEQGTDFVNQVNGNALLNPVTQQVSNLTDELNTISPGQILTPLQEPYDIALDGMNNLDPTQWLTPIVEFYNRIDLEPLINAIDIDSVLDRLQQSQQQLFNQVRDAILTAVNSLTLPEELNSLFANLKPVLENLLDGIFSQQSTTGGELNLGNLFDPLDELFDRLLEQLENLLQDSLSTVLKAVEPIRQTIANLQLERFSPSNILARFNLSPDRLAALAPTAILATPLQLTELRQTWQAKLDQVPAERREDFSAISERFDRVLNFIGLLEPASIIDSLTQTYERWIASLQPILDRFNLDTATAVYERLVRSLPDFLFQTESFSNLTSETAIELIRNGINSLRPSTQAVASLSQPLQLPNLALGETINNFFAQIRELAMRLDPRPLLQIVREIFALFNPQALIEPIQTVFAALTEPLAAIDPSAIQSQLNDVFNSVVNTLSTSVGNLINELANILEEQLSDIRQQVLSIFNLVNSAIYSLTQLFRESINQFERLLFVEIIERLNRIIDNLGISFEQELNRVRNAFDQMLAAIPV
jgi:hypothetical protein